MESQLILSNSTTVSVWTTMIAEIEVLFDRYCAEGAEERLDAAPALKTELEKILEGEEPFDIFVRWKKLCDQPLGWDLGVNDGARFNIRPFCEAGVLRENTKKLNIRWDKDRGKDVDSAPWVKRFNNERINDHHLSLAEKKTAREFEEVRYVSEEN